MEIIKVSSKTDTKALAGAITEIFKQGKKIEIQTIGAGALNQAVKGIAIARSYLALNGINLVCIPAFYNIEIENEEMTAIKLIVKGEQ